MRNVGIIGLGFIGKIHLATIRKMGLAKVVAVADHNPAALRGDAQPAGNLSMDSGDTSLEGVALYADGQALINDPAVDYVLIALPTDLHAQYATAALKAGKPVFCEKPVVRHIAEGEALLAAQRESGEPVFVGHCLRFWPIYEKARSFVFGGEFGKTLHADFARLSPKPTWSNENWLLDERRSGGCLQDLHIHDVDFVLHTFGKPEFISAAGFFEEGKGYGDVCTHFRYKEDLLVNMQGGWSHPAGFPFRMSFRIVLEEGTLEFNSLTGGQLWLYPAGGGAEEIELDPEDGYTREHRYFLHCLSARERPQVISLASALETVAVIEEIRAKLSS